MPEFPSEMRRYLEWDTGPRRPWEDDLIDAHQWELAKAVQTAYREGQQAARSSHEAHQQAREHLEARMRGQAAC